MLKRKISNPQKKATVSSSLFVNITLWACAPEVGGSDIGLDSSQTESLNTLILPLLADTWHFAHYFRILFHQS
jgi:hypothetical protein